MMEKLILDQHTRSDRNNWSWTDRNEVRAKHIESVLDELREWWPVTIRQLFYRLISSPLVNDPCWQWGGKTVDDIYKAMGRTLKWMRIDDRIPWDSITDEHRIVTDKRGLTDVSHFVSQQIRCFLKGYSRCVAQQQPYYIEVWLEKMALLHIVEPVADEFCRRVVVCRGYNSITFETDFYKRAAEAINRGEKPLIIYFGDWDPSGWNMAYTIIQTFEDELDLVGVEYHRGGICQEHFQEIPADPVPIKPKDTRSERFIGRYGPTAYELDAFHPQRLQELVRECIQSFTDMDAYQENEERETEDFEQIESIRERVISVFDEEINKGGNEAP